ncbi:unnamed protein product [Ixodes persulcatus]
MRVHTSIFVCRNRLPHDWDNAADGLRSGLVVSSHGGLGVRLKGRLIPFGGLSRASALSNPTWHLVGCQPRLCSVCAFQPWFILCRRLRSRFAACVLFVVTTQCDFICSRAYPSPLF